MKLFDYYRSSASFRARIALGVKGVACEIVSVNLLEGANRGDEYRRINSQGLVPCLVTPEGARISQSGAILEWLEMRYPEPPLFPQEEALRVRMRTIMDIIACDMHPLNNSGVLNYLRSEFAASEEAIRQWYHHWLKRSFTALEQSVLATPYCLGDQLSAADLYLIPQLYNARRFSFDPADYPKLCSIDSACMRLPAFVQATPNAP